MTPMQHTRIRAYCQSAQTPLPFISSAYRTVAAPDAVITALWAGPQPAYSPANTPILETALAELVRTLGSVTWDTGVRTLPARPRTGETSRLGSRRPAPGKAARVRGSTARSRATATSTTS